MQEITLSITIFIRVMSLNTYQNKHEKLVEKDFFSGHYILNN
jgi:hypothetical protein